MGKIHKYHIAVYTVKDGIKLGEMEYFTIVSKKPLKSEDLQFELLEVDPMTITQNWSDEDD